MNKAEMIEAMANKSGMSKVEAGKALAAMMAAINDALTKGDAVQLIGFGSFAVSERAARNGRNPATGSTVKIAAKKVVKFKAGKALADAVAGTK